MLRSKTFWILFAVAVVAVLAVSVTLILINGSRQPTVETIGNPASMQVELLRPSDSGRFSAGTGISPLVTVHSEQPVAEVVLYDNGLAVADQKLDGTNKSVLQNWSINGFQPGDHQLYALAVDAQGHTSVSNSVHIFINEWGMSEMRALDGDTLESIAQQFQVDMQALMDANPGMGAGDELSTGAVVNIPTGNSNEGSIAPVQPVSVQLSTLPGAPSAPRLETSPNGCQTEIIIQDQSDDEDGFLVYRLDDSNTEFQLVNSFPQHTGGAAPSFTDQNLQGHVTYYAVAFNEIGESMSTFVSLDFDPAACGDNSLLSLRNGVLNIELPLDVAYFYASINGRQYLRYPREDGDFFPPSSTGINLVDVMAADLKKVNAPYNLSLDVWGWQGSSLVYVGKIDARLDATVLEVCSTGVNSCTGDVGGTMWRMSGQSDPNSADTSERQFRWTYSTYATTAIVQVSRTAFTASDGINPADLVVSKVVQASFSGANGSQGLFVIDFAALEGTGQLSSPVQLTEMMDVIFPEEENTPVTQTWASQALAKMTTNSMIDASQFTGIENPMYYIRVIPVPGNLPSGSRSNTVPIEIAAEQQPNLTVLTPEPPFENPFEVEYVSYTDPVAPYLPWGCVKVTYLDPSAKFVYPMEFDYWNQYYQSGEPLCPERYHGEDKPWYEDLWDFLTSAFSWVADVYNSIKNAVFDVIADGLSGLGICDECTLVRAALDAGLVALGIPPELPDLSKLTEDGFTYLAEQAVEAAGVDCDSLCEDIIRDGLNTLKEETLAQTVSGFSDEQIAHEHGMEPLFIAPEPYMTVEPLNGDHWGYAQAVIRVTRRPGTENISLDDINARNFTIHFTMTAVNEYWVGHELDFYNATCAMINDYSSYYPCGDIYYPVTEPLEGKLFETSILVPMLAPGESTEITLLLPPRLVTPQEVAPDLLEKGYGPGIDALVTYTNGQVVQQDAVWNDINHIWFPGTQVPANNAWDELYMHAPQATVTVSLSALRNMSMDPNHPWMQDYFYPEAVDTEEFTLNDIGDVWGMVSPHP